MRVFGWAGASLFALMPMASAGVITFTNSNVDLHGTGFGNVLNVLAVQKKDHEFGSVIWNGSADVLGGDATIQSQTRTVSELIAHGMTGGQMALYFNANEPVVSQEVLVDDFTLHFMDAAGGLLFDATYTAPDGGLVLGDFAGTGRTGWLFNVQLTDSEAAQFFANGGNRVGMSILDSHAIQWTAGGPENFFLGPPQSPGPGGGGGQVPEPASLACWAACGLVGLFVRRRTRVTE
jgi:hypothetical protein